MAQVRIHESGTNKKIGWVDVDNKEVEKAFEMFESPTSLELRKEKDRWIRDRGAGIAIWHNRKCYPHKMIMRIATWKEVNELAERQTDIALKNKIRSGIDKLRGGYTVENAEKGCCDLGLTIKDVSRNQKEECWR